MWVMWPASHSITSAFAPELVGVNVFAIRALSPPQFVDIVVEKSDGVTAL